MNLARFAIRRPITVMMIVVGIMILGFVSSGKISVNLLPDITYPKVTIRTEYPHAAPAEVEEFVTIPIEQAVGIITEVMSYSSVSKPGISEVVVEFSWRSDMDVKTMDIREKLQITESFLPEEIKRPVILRYDPSTDPIITIAVAADMDLADLRYLVEREVERELERIDGVAAVKVQGGYEEEIVVEVDEAKLAQYNLTIQTVIDRLRRENINLAGGTLEDAGQELSVRTLNQFQTLDDIRDIVVLSSAPVSGAATSMGGGSATQGMPAGMGGIAGLLSGFGGMAGLSGIMSAFMPSEEAGEGGAAFQVSAPIRLRDIASVSSRHKERTEIARLNSQECIKVAVYKEGDANVVRVAEEVHKSVERIRQNLRVDVRSEQWERKLRSPGRKLRQALNGAFSLLFSFKPFNIPEEPLKLVNDLDIVIISDQSVFIIQAINSVIQMAIWGSVIAIFVLYFFLRNPGSTVIIALAIPISIITTFIIMYFAGISFNTMSLGGLALGVGLLVDNSIVVLENILRNRVMVTDLEESASIGANEVATAITASTLTNIMVFFPILYVEGMFRQVFGDLAWTVTISIVTSEFVALAVIPMLSVHFGKGVRLPAELLDEMELPEGYELPRDEPAAEPAARPGLKIISFGEYRRARGKMIGSLFTYPLVLQAIILGFWAQWLKRATLYAFQVAMFYPLKAFDASFTWLKHSYPLMMRRLVRMPGTVFASAIGMSALTLFSLYILGWELMPNVDQGEFRVNVKLKTGTPIERTNERVALIEDKVRQIPDSRFVRNLFSTVGTGVAEGELEAEKSENIGEINVIMAPLRERDFTDDQFINRVRAKLSDEVDLDAGFSKPQLLSYKTPIEIEIVGYNLEELRESADVVASAVKDIPGTYDIDTSTKERNPEITIHIDRDRASSFGLTVGEITDSIRKKIKGELATKLDKGDRQVDIIVKASEQDRSTLRDIDLLTIKLPTGGAMPLKSVADIVPSRGPGSITRSGNSRIALITANLSERTLGDVVSDIEDKLENMDLPHGVFWRITGQNEEMQRSLKSLYLAIFLAICLVYIVLAIQFESLLHPFVIMFCVPFSLVGLTILMYLTGTTINVFSLIGMMMMFGISVNDAIVMITTINQRRAAGMERIEAVIDGARMRLRPILITTTTTVLGMFPMALPLGEGAELRNPLAIAVIGGILSSTFFTLTAIPSAYIVVDRLGELFRLRRKKEEAVQ